MRTSWRVEKFFHPTLHGHLSISRVYALGVQIAPFDRVHGRDVSRLLGSSFAVDRWANPSCCHALHVPFVAPTKIPRPAWRRPEFPAGYPRRLRLRHFWTMKMNSHLMLRLQLSLSRWCREWPSLSRWVNRQYVRGWA